jgi:hypothetical protein
VGDRVFIFGDINFDFNFLNDFCKILDNGFKFIPLFYSDEFYLFKRLINSIDLEMINFNKQFHLKKINNKDNDNFNQCEDTIVNDSINDTFILDPLDSIIKNMKNKRIINRCPLYEESILLQLELLKELKNVRFNNKTNLNLSQIQILKKFCKSRPFKVVELDKNVGSAILSHELYNKLTYDHLNNPDVYLRLDNDPLMNLKDNLRFELNSLYYSKDISKKLDNKLFDDNIQPKLGNIRILPKIHKSKFSVRPIINYGNNPVSKLCILVDFVLRPFVVASDSYIKDSQDLMQKALKFEINADKIHLFSCDFESLYTNINQDDCLFIICDFLKDKFKSKHLTLFGFSKILNFVLKNNFFIFNNEFFQQKKGIAMGSKCGPSIANIFVFCFEKKWLTIHRPLFYYRFIDDIFVILTEKELIQSLTHSFGDLRLNVVNNDVVNFLDLEINFDHLTKTLVFKPYFKPTKTFSYLLCDSNHPDFIFKNIPKSLFIRLRRICTFSSDFVYYSSILRKQLINRGYSSRLLDKVFNMVFKLNRLDLLSYKTKEKLDFNKIFYKSTFDKNIANFNYIFKNSFENVFNDDTIYKPKYFLINKMQNNLGSLLIHNFKFPICPINRYTRCLDLDCNTCLYANTDFYIDLGKNYPFPITVNSNCESINCVYLILCKFCNSFYIGQTKNLNKRIYQHIYSIKNFSAFSEKHFSSTAVHFNLLNHNFNRDFCFFILRNNIDNLDSRLIIESFYINLFKKLELKVFNDHIPIIKTKFNFEYF